MSSSTISGTKVSVRPEGCHSSRRDLIKAVLCATFNLVAWTDFNTSPLHRHVGTQMSVSETHRNRVSDDKCQQGIFPPWDRSLLNLWRLKCDRRQTQNRTPATARFLPSKTRQAEKKPILYSLFPKKLCDIKHTYKSSHLSSSISTQLSNIKVALLLEKDGQRETFRKTGEASYLLKKRVCWNRTTTWSSSVKSLSPKVLWYIRHVEDME